LTQKDRILVLRTIKHGESDLIIHGLNPLGAKLSFLAKGALKSRKRFPGGILEPTHYLEVGYKVKSSNDDTDPLHFLLEAHMIRDFPKLRTDYARLDAALYLLKIVAKLGQQGTVDSPDLFNLLGNALQAAETSTDLDALKLSFELKLLATQGVLPPEEAFTPWLEPTLAQHAEVKASREQKQRALAQAHELLQQYLGQIN
jgi:DNA repair protein RecO (recombination protein O)